MARITAVFMVYDGGDPHLNTALPRVISWLEANSQFDVDYRVIRSNTANGSSNLITPGDADWDEIPDAQFVFLLNASNQPSSAGGTWGVGPPDYGFWRTALPSPLPPEWPNMSGICSVCAISFRPWWSWIWDPDQGFESGFELTLMHEWKNAIDSWIKDGLGFSIMNTYERADGYYINCDLFPPATERTECYGAVLDQITPEMYAAIESDRPLPVPTGGSLLPLALFGLVGGIIVAAIGKNRAK